MKYTLIFNRNSIKFWQFSMKLGRKYRAISQIIEFRLFWNNTISINRVKICKLRINKFKFLNLPDR